MTKIEAVKRTLKRSKAKSGVTIHELVKRSGVKYETARRSANKLAARGVVEKVGPKRCHVTGKYLVGYKLTEAAA